VRIVAVLIAIALWASSAFAGEQADRKNLCDRRSGGKTVLTTYGSLTLAVQEPRTDGDACSFKITTSSDEELAHDDFADYIPQPDYVDLDGDGAPELVVVAGSYGSGGYADSYVFSQTPRPRLIRAVREACPFQVVKGAQAVALLTCELDFGSFDGLCNACSPRPAVYLRVEQGVLRDHSSDFASAYDSHISEQRKLLKPADLQAFLKSRSQDDALFERSDARALVLSIAIDYIYSGREAQARETLETMWPAWDRERVWADIINTRSVGVLERLH
jgi:hypothetical protein